MDIIFLFYNMLAERKGVVGMLVDMEDFLEYLYPSDMAYKGEFLLFNIDTKTSKFVGVNDKHIVVEYIQAEAAKRNTVQINLALQLEREAKIEKVQEDKTKHEILEALYKKYINPSYGNKAVQEKTKRLLRSVKQQEKELGINLNKKKAQLQKDLVSFDVMQQKLNEYSDYDIHGCFKADIEVLTQNILSRVRGKVGTVSEIFGLWLDIDVQVEGHHNEQHNNYFNSFEQAIDFIISLPIKPTIIINSGGGLHVYYKFNEMLRLNTMEERNEINLIYKLFSEYVNQEANKIDKEIDKSNILKMMRIPFTYNLKNLNNPKWVTIEYFEESNKLKYEDVKSFLNDGIKKYNHKLAQQSEHNRSTSDKVADADLIYERCNWVRHKVDNQNACGYEDWNLLMMLCTNLEDGYNKAHDWSKDYYKYNPIEVTSKFEEFAEKGFKPFLCDKVSNSGLCMGCELFNKGKSPIRLGYKSDYKK